MKKLLIFGIANVALLAQFVVKNATLTGKIVLTIQNASPILQVNCIFGSVSCTTPSFSFDPPNHSKFSGYADPSDRQDPQTGIFWRAYSFPKILANGTANVEIHVAYNTGSGWTNSGLNNNGILYSSQVVPNGVTGTTDDQTSDEVITLMPSVVSGTTYWYAMHSQYLVPRGSHNTSSQNYTGRLEIVGCAGTASQGPMCLLTATPQWTGGSVVNQTYWPISVNWTNLSSGAATDWRENTFAISGGNLYLFLETANLASYYQFSTPNPHAHLGSWSWSFVSNSQFATSTDANSICSYLNTCANTNYLSQAEFAFSHANGDPGICMDSLYLDGGGVKHSAGIYYLHLASISPPAFDNPIQVKAVVTSTDSTVVGPGSCGYEPNYSGGLDIVNKQTSCINCPVPGGNYTYMQDTNLRP